MSEPALFPASAAGGIDLEHPDTSRLGYDPDDMLRTAWLSDDGKYRWTLSRLRAGAPDDRLTFIMLNPSDANALVDDPTVRKCMGFATRLGYSGIWVVNLFPWRATKPPDMWAAERAGEDIGGGGQGRKVLREALAGPSDKPVVAAWGANVPNAHPRVQWLLQQPGADRLHALSITKRGEPGHPLMLPYSCLPIPWRAA